MQREEQGAIPPQPEISSAAEMEEGEGEESRSGYHVRSSAFEGPLDLLLYLVSKDKLDINEVSLAQITADYWAHVRVLQALDLNVESSFLVVFACLLEIKSRLLLPPEPEPEMVDHFDLGDTEEYDLVDRLREYKKFKEASLVLHRREREARLVFPRPPSTERLEPTSLDVSLPDLLEALRGVLDAHQKRVKKRPDIRLKKVAVSVPQRMKELLAQLVPGQLVAFGELFANEAGRDQIIVTFLALLELTRLRRVRVSQEAPQAPILVVRDAGDEDATAELLIEEEIDALQAQHQKSSRNWVEGDEWTDDTPRLGFSVGEVGDPGEVDELVSLRLAVQGEAT